MTAPTPFPESTPPRVSATPPEFTPPSEATPRLPETFRDCLDFFYGRNQFAIKLGLENINALLDRLGRPDKGLTILHVAGTNGKGSVCSNLAALLTASGYKRVGLYTSPHLVSFRERILVDGAPIPADYIVSWLRQNRAAILELNTTYFESITALALDYFRSVDCEAVVLETGLGGRLDATNAVTSTLSVITSISLDHTSILGNTIAEIWGEKTAILKPGVPMVVAETKASLLSQLKVKAEGVHSNMITMQDHPWTEVISSEVGENSSACASLDSVLRFQGRYATYELPCDLRTESHQRDNLALSLVAMEIFLKGPLPASDKLIPVLRASSVPGRTQLLEEPGMLPLLLDGAHNPAGMEALADHIRKEFPGRRVVAFFSVMRDKDFAAVYRSVQRFASQVCFIPLAEKYPRALSFTDLQAALDPSECETLQELPLAGEEWLKLLKKPDMGAPQFAPIVPIAAFDIAVVCGSLYLLGEVIPRLLHYYHGLNWFRQFEHES